MDTSIVIIIIGLFIFWGHYLAGLFERKGIPDVLGLMLIGMLIGPIFHLIHPASFGKFGSLFSNLVLIFILFESGTDLKIDEVKASFRDSAAITTFGFLTTWVATVLLCTFFLDLPLLPSLFIGATLGGTSSAVVVGLVKKIGVQPRTSTTLIIESAESDIFTLAIPLSILTLMITGELAAYSVVSQFISSIIISLIMGIGGAFLWSFIINKIPALKKTKFSTPAFLLVIYGITEYLHFSGPLTALSFGIAIGNLEYFEPKLLEKYVPNQRIILPKAERSFFGQLVFLLRTFFFVFIGISIKIDRLDWLIWGAAITAVLFLVRIVLVKFVIRKNTPLLDKAVMSMMIPKGLGAAVIATLPLQQGNPYGEIIQAICFSVILFSTLYCVVLFFLVNQKLTLPIYGLIYGKDRPIDKEVN
ncbi:MAG: cation:proton antiporter [Saprospiraceae bacterium]|jgi:cell volume regulation protein A|uniref:cation:proton antiporter n=1 Tax=Candidatus Brachybacter algidus TaxID=2982024 RepID=UPI001B42D96C|nr:cation:proton antiporter [Candidatus Brachybacter algidus]MBP7306201.1 cation:proton antiporter [Saprospiraceae bacterium]MBK6449626.1 cation:proton antiporter [Candidatus Brachybacter algidus]MBK7604487.1 cation:proton antiporter [Candidatus Brachybacter algidus]MBK8355341.1 cation:proton antiporter [Candidatus Brachybacter algidus]MBK8603952.1 cation:proton antiporter [Candidatus Brachybacter algidus]